MKKEIYAKVTMVIDGEEVVKAAKRTVDLYEDDCTVDSELLRRANKALVLDEQASMRNTLLVKYGAKTEGKERAVPEDAEQL